MRNIPNSVDGYLADLPDDARETLEEMRRMIRAAAPDAVEGISYGMPGFKYRDVRSSTSRRPRTTAPCTGQQLWLIRRNWQGMTFPRARSVSRQVSRCQRRL